ncbi:MAG: hypothetical protein JRD04_12745 [Deltaproteobacteria bacterium]|nr:hypothetical protein [Deltaproteobacteria bacterium]
MRKIWNAIVMGILFVSLCSLGVCAEEVTKSIVEGSGWTHTIGEVVGMLLTIVSGLAAVGVPILLMRIWKKLGLESNATINSLIISAIKQGINYADAWAIAQGAKPAGDKKIQIAINYILGKLKQYKIPQIAEEKIREMIEAQLARNKVATNA